MIHSLEERIWNAVPATHQAFAKLLGLLEIRESRAVTTAAVTTGTQSRLLVNPDFAREHCRTDARLATLVLHELMHVLLGHTRVYRTITPLQNFVFDALINAHLCVSFPDPGRTALFRSLYRADQFPEALLRPPEGWGTPSVAWRMTGAALRAHQALYTSTSATFKELAKLLEKTLAQPDETSKDGGSSEDESNPRDEGSRQTGHGGPGGVSPIEDVPLLGNHDHVLSDDAAEDQRQDGLDSDTVAEFRRIAADWPGCDRNTGRDDGTEARADTSNVERARRDAVVTLRRALVGVLDLGANGRGVLQRELTLDERVVPYRSQHDRRATVLELMGQVALFHREEATNPLPEQREKVHVYLDVSGSMYGVLPLLLGAVIPVFPYIHDQVHQFSTEVVDIPLARVKSGEIQTTGGTDIKCVTRHMIANKVRRAVVLTDGWVGCVSRPDALTLRRRKVRVNSVVLDGGDPSFATALRGNVYLLPNLV